MTEPEFQSLIPADPGPVDPIACYWSDARPAPTDRPWLMLNMIASADGAISVDGVSGGLGGPADQRVFGAVRSVADAILVAAGTARAEQYGPPRPSDAVRRRRREAGRDETPVLGLVTRSLAIDPELAMFTGAERRPIVYTVDTAPADRKAALAEVADIVTVGERDVDLGAAVADLGNRGAAVVLAEGGPSLNGQLVAADLIDELCLSLSPLVVAGDSGRIVAGPAIPAPRELRLDRALTADDLLFLRYVRRT